MWKLGLTLIFPVVMLFFVGLRLHYWWYVERPAQRARVARQLTRSKGDK